LPEGTATLIRNLINERTGMFFDNGKGDLLMDKLSPLVIERGFSSYLDYYYLLKYDAAAGSEWQNVMNTLSVLETYFWREMDQMRALVRTMLPQWQARNPNSTVRIWSAACATGEEPLTIAMTLNEAGWFERTAVEIFASDASTNAIAQGRTGRALCLEARWVSGGESCMSRAITDRKPSYSSKKSRHLRYGALISAPGHNDFANVQFARSALDPGMRHEHRCRTKIFPAA